MVAYYNENDPKTAAWLRELIKAKLIADGEVDTRSIVDVQSADLVGFRQCHFFAGIGGWSYALRLAGWPDDRECWTGSCPCQPFSVAGKGQGADDTRDLWPTWRELIAECGPPVVFGEQVAGAAGSYWLDRVFGDMEAQAFAVAAADLCAPWVGAPHLRQRVYFVADAGCKRRQQDTGRASRHEGAHEGRASRNDHVVAGDGEGRCDGLANDDDEGSLFSPRDGESAESVDIASGHDAIGRSQNRERVADADSGHGFWWSGPLQVGWNAIEAEVTRGCRRYRAQWRIKPGLSLLAHGIPGRVDLLRGYGNAIVPQVAAEFIGAYMEIAGSGEAETPA